MILPLIALSLAALPAGLFLANLLFYRKLPAPSLSLPSCSVLIPARDEIENIGELLHSVLRSSGIDLEVIVLDDNSTDGTADAVASIAQHDRRVRLERSAPLPPGWTGKNFACDQLAKLAKHPILVFLDADVRVARPESLGRLVSLLDRDRLDLVSGIPGQETGTLLEKVIVPLIHFILLGFLPLRWMQRTSDPRFAAACGQIVAVRRGPYHAAGGHRTIRNRLHDGIAIARNVRAGGGRTDLFDATDTFRCRMYRSAAEVWQGFSRTSREGLASDSLILPSSIVLLGGQVLPVLLLIAGRLHGLSAWLAFALVFGPRLLGSIRFRQSLLGALLHPVSIVLVVIMQWQAFARSLRGDAVSWRGRPYFSSASP